MNNINLVGNKEVYTRFVASVPDCVSIGGFFTSLLENVFTYWKKNIWKTSVYKPNLPGKFKDTDALYQNYREFYGKPVDYVIPIVHSFVMNERKFEIECTLCYDVRFDDIGVVKYLRKFHFELSNVFVEPYDFVIQDPLGVGDYKYLGIWGLEFITFRDTDLDSIATGDRNSRLLDVF